jgi:hypothetical protein
LAEWGPADEAIAVGDGESAAGDADEAVRLLGGVATSIVVGGLGDAIAVRECLDRQAPVADAGVAQRRYVVHQGDDSDADEVGAVERGEEEEISGERAVDEAQAGSGESGVGCHVMSPPILNNTGTHELV